MFKKHTFLIIFLKTVSRPFRLKGTFSGSFFYINKNTYLNVLFY